MLFSWKCIIQDRDDRVSGNSQLNLAWDIMKYCKFVQTVHIRKQSAYSSALQFKLYQSGSIMTTLELVCHTLIHYLQS
jgi:hypothetical protein